MRKIIYDSNNKLFTVKLFSEINLPLNKKYSEKIFENAKSLDYDKINKFIADQFKIPVSQVKDLNYTLISDFKLNKILKKNYHDNLDMLSIYGYGDYSTRILDSTVITTSDGINYTVIIFHLFSDEKKVVIMSDKSVLNLNA